MLEDGVSVGPFGYLRPGTVLRQGAKVGTFVEVKNSDIGAGAQDPAPLLHRRRGRRRGHEPGRGDDHRQLRRPRQAPHDHRRRVRTGVDTTLVAPVSVGDDAYTGAGSVITEDVPPGALGIARERQSNIEGYAERRGGSG